MEQFYTTDFEAYAPTRTNLVRNLPPVFYICRDSDYNQNFADAVSEYARVITLGDSKDIDLNEAYEKMEEQNQAAMHL